MTDTQLEKTLWSTADKLRANMDAAEYKHVVLGLIFLKYISDAFEARHQQLDQELSDPSSDYYVAEPAARYNTLEDRDEYTAENVYYVPPSARWKHLQSHAKLPTIGTELDEAMEAIERDNPRLKGVLPKIYGRPTLDKMRLGQLIDLIGTIGMGGSGHMSKDLLGRVYEYFLGQFADAEGKKGGQFYTPGSIVRLMVEMLEPYQGRIYDGACGSGGMFVQSDKFIEEHRGRKDAISVFGQESNPTTHRLARMNLAIRGIEATIELGDTLLHDAFPDLKADFVLANPPFNISDWNGEQLRDDRRWKYGVPPLGNANFAWLQHFVHKLSPKGRGGIVLANGSMTSASGGEDAMRRELVQANLVDCMVALPTQLFFNTQIPACIWFLARDRASNPQRDRSKEILFIDARQLGTMISRRNRELTETDIRRVADVYHNWRCQSASVGPNGEPPVTYLDEPGFCRAASIEEVEAHGFVLTPGRYVGTEDVEENEEYEELLQELGAELATQLAESAQLEDKIRQSLLSVGITI
ncbi:SAM-dependent DNA methyltransferase [Hymenobacter aquaticus]|uniref:site-specific DNA-methyltransferase (adenine-specific) n=1 Tax=Hymenobacter aquaticus TaxID=1867101 RepID=A0A4Z0Q1T9_9BACT|nr:class I SAM-dependent DNA methyltransferase [Hymenobacter aquaticus]TGE23950.1 SAM-dependent DNA methyltransferase [Hymenobacter aquaticus]